MLCDEGFDHREKLPDFVNANGGFMTGGLNLTLEAHGNLYGGFEILPRKRTGSCRLSFVVPTGLLLIAIAFGLANGQYARVRRITVETNNGVRVTAWTTRQSVTLRQEVIIFYEVANRSNKTIYLVRKRGELETFIDGDALVIPIPLPFPEGHGGYDYSFTKVQRGRTHKGQLTIPAGRFNREQTWLINVNFGFVTDISGLNRQLGSNEDPAPLRGQLGERICSWE